MVCFKVGLFSIESGCGSVLAYKRPVDGCSEI